MENQNQNQRRCGIITKFSSTYGFIKSKNPDNPSQLQTFFAHLTNVEECEGDIPREGDTAEFDISPIPAKEGKCRYAVNIRVFSTPVLSLQPLAPNALAATTLAGIDLLVFPGTDTLAEKDDKAGV